jgi:predicted DNA-binding antitoxin AbrB/MazE fold protein
VNIAVDAIYEDGVLKPKAPVNLPEKAEVHLMIETEPPSKTPLGRDLRALRAKALAEGAPLLDADAILEEVRGRRGGFRE